MTIAEFEHYSAQFLEHLRLVRNLSAHTIRAYRADLLSLVELWKCVPAMPNGKHVDLKEAVSSFLLKLHQRSIDKTSIARKISCLRSFITYLKAEHEITVHLKLTRPRLDKKLPAYLTIDDMQRALHDGNAQTLPSPAPLRDLAIIELLYATGIRCGELVVIRMLHLNMADRTIIIRGKGRRERVVVFGDHAAERLSAYLAHERPAVRHTAEHLFLNYRKQPLATRSIQRICTMMRTHINIDRPLTPHKIRHSFATHLINEGADLCTVQKLLGHASLASTEKYTHVSLEHIRSLCEHKHPLQSRAKPPKPLPSDTP